jgi:hypothetical protein
MSKEKKLMTAEKRVIMDLNELKFQHGAGWEYIATCTVVSPVPFTIEDAEREVQSLNINRCFPC